MQMALSYEIIGRLDVAMEGRPLSTDEFDFRLELKCRFEGLAVILKMQHRQCSRLTYIRVGDANTHQFHIHANGRHRKKIIEVFQTDDGVAVDMEDKEASSLTTSKATWARPPAATLVLILKLLAMPLRICRPLRRASVRRKLKR